MLFIEKKKQADSAYTVIYLYNRGENLRVMENLSNVASQAPSLMREIKKKAHSQTSWETANRNQLVSLWTKTWAPLLRSGFCGNRVFVTVAGPLTASSEDEYQTAEINPLPLRSTSRSRFQWLWPYDLNALKNPSLVNQNLLMFYHQTHKVIKDDHCVVSSLCGKRHMDKWPLFITSHQSVLHPLLAKVLSQLKVSKFIPTDAYMWLTCAQREHLHVFELQRGVGWVQGLAVVCHVHVCQHLGQTKFLLPDSGAKRLVQEANVCPPTSSSSFFSSSFPSHTLSHLHQNAPTPSLLVP